MFDFDCEVSWDVGQEAESLNKSLFEGEKKKKSKKGKKTDDDALPSQPSSSIIYHSDDEVFTKKGIRKMKEKKRKQKKKGGESAESAESADTQLSSGKREKKYRHDSKMELDVSLETTKKSGKKGKTQKAAAGATETKKSVKRKRESSESGNVEGTLEAPKKKSKKPKEGAPSISSSNTLSADEPAKKRKRNRKKKNNSKKNKYAHLALNKKEKVEGGTVTLNTDPSQSSVLKVAETKAKPDAISKRFSHKDKTAVPEVQNTSQIITNGKPSKQKKVKEAAGTTVESSPKPSKKGKVKTPKTEMSKDSPSPTNVTESSPSKKKNKRKKSDGSNLQAKKMKIENGSAAQDADVKASPKLKPKDGTKQKKKSAIQNAQSNNNAEITRSAINSSSLQKKVQTNLDPKKVLESQQQQKKLLTALKKAGLDTSVSDKDGSFPNKKEKNKKKKQPKRPVDTTAGVSEEDSSIVPTSPNLKKKGKNQPQAKKGSETPKQDLSAKSQDKQEVKALTPNRSSVWGDKNLGGQAREKLNAARFRYLNEQLYTCQGREAMQLFREDREAFKVYHTGFENQATKWPINPVNILIKQLKDKSADLVLADFGCGDAKLAKALPQKVHSFDLVALNPWVTACDMTKVPLPNESVDVAVFCLSLMGTNLDDYIHEANRVLKTGGLLKIVEVVSRFSGLSTFLAGVCSHGFQLLNKRDLSQMFYLMDFRKVKVVKKASTKGLSLKPCVYKKR